MREFLTHCAVQDICSVDGFWSVAREYVYIRQVRGITKELKQPKYPNDPPLSTGCYGEHLEYRQY